MIKPRDVLYHKAGLEAGIFLCLCFKNKAVVTKFGEEPNTHCVLGDISGVF